MLVVSSLPLTRPMIASDSCTRHLCRLPLPSVPSALFCLTAVFLPSLTPCISLHSVSHSAVTLPLFLSLSCFSSHLATLSSHATLTLHLVFKNFLSHFLPGSLPQQLSHLREEIERGGGVQRGEGRGEGGESAAEEREGRRDGRERRDKGMSQGREREHGERRKKGKRN